MIGVLIISHGKFSTEILKSAELIIGKQKNVSTLNLNESDDIQKLSVKVSEQISKLDHGQGVLILTDLFGGSPSNITLANMRNKSNVSSITGVNLPMVIEALTLRHNNSIEELVNYCQTAAVKGIKDLSKMISTSN